MFAGGMSYMQCQLAEPWLELVGKCDETSRESYGNHSTGERSAVDFRVAQWLDFERLGSEF